jgi:hypothetical protein
MEFSFFFSDYTEKYGGNSLLLQLERSTSRDCVELNCDLHAWQIIDILVSSISLPKQLLVTTAFHTPRNCNIKLELHVLEF